MDKNKSGGCWKTVGNLCTRRIGIETLEHTTIATFPRYHTGNGKNQKKLEDKYGMTNVVAGVGASGTVRIVVGKQGTAVQGKKFVLKSLPLNMSTKHGLKNEVGLLLTLDHPNVVRLMDAFETSWKLHLVMEYCSGKELYDRVLELGQFSEEEAANTCVQMLKAVNYLHIQKPPVVHRDLKLENFLYVSKDSDYLKLIDFGVALSGQLRGFAGTELYAAPEVHRSIRTGQGYDEKVDVWSLGVTTYSLLTGRSMFAERAMQMGCPWDQAVDSAFEANEFRSLTIDAQDFIRKLVSVTPEHRINLTDALKHPWIVGQSRPSNGAPINMSVLKSVRNFSCASHFRKACLYLMAYELTAEDCKQLRLVFEELDTEKTGTISLADFKALFTANFNVKEDLADVFRPLTEFDGNSESICYSEFIAAAMQDRVKMHEETVHQTFERFDTGSKGYITVEDLKASLGSNWHGEATAEEVFREADLENKGKLTYQDFMAYLCEPTQVSAGTEMWLKPEKVEELWKDAAKKGELAAKFFNDPLPQRGMIQSTPWGGALKFPKYHSLEHSSSGPPDRAIVKPRSDSAGSGAGASLIPGHPASYS